jgi:SpoVK/Ycf46/Vps4 family AAA+-type ATPase
MKKYRFKSSTDINNYNKFLLDLDGVIKENKTKTIEKEPIQTCVDNINKLYDEANGFNSMSKLDILCNAVDPNEYSALEPKVPNLNLDSIRNDIRNDIKNDIKHDIRNDIKHDIKKKFIIKRPEVEPIIKHHVTIDVEINHIGDLLKLIDAYPDDKETKYNINMSLLHKIKEPLNHLNNMIGMKYLKENIVDQILFYVQNLHKPFLRDTGIRDVDSCNDFMHTVIYGPPGTGKTEIAKIMGQLFTKIGVLNKGTFKKVTRSDLVAGFLGQTALKTKDVIKECLGGVLFIDEAYSLGSPEKRDSFSKECIDTLCEALSDHKDDLMVIIAGYETELNECFFGSNQGLKSRFTWRFKTDEYSAEDLYHIFIKKVKNAGWEIFDIKNESKDKDKDIDVKWFEKHKQTFKFYGRDIETLFAKVKIAHSRRVFCLDDSVKQKITINDLNKGYAMFLKNNTTDSKREDNMRQIISSMYM